MQLLRRLRRKLDKTEIRIAGSGGQGVVLASQILGKAAVLDGKNAVQTQAYGAEARGSLSRGEVIISDGKIHFPSVRESDILVAMNQESLNVFIKRLKTTGLLLVDSTNITDIPETEAKIHNIPFTGTAKKAFGETIYANIIMLGALTKITGVVTEKAIERALTEIVPKKLVETNIRAFRKGLQL